MRRLLLSSISILTLTSSGLAQSQEVNPVDDVDIIVVEATRTHIDSFDYPGMTSVISKDTLDLLRPSDLDDLLSALPGVEISGGPRRTGQTISLRGQGRENTTLLLDGARQNFSSAHDGAIFVDPSLIVSVESVRGAASSLYGSGASGGVIALRTANALDLLSEHETHGFSLGLGMRTVDGEQRSSGSVYGLADNLDLLVSVSRRQSGDITLGSGDELPASYEAVSGLFKLGISISEGVRAELGWQIFDGRAIEPNNGQGLAEASASNALAAKDITNNNLTFSFNASPANAEWLDLDLTAYRNQSNVDEEEITARRTLRRDLETVGIRADQRFAFALGAYDAGLTLGGEYYRDQQDGHDSTSVDTIRGGAPDASTRFAASYVQLELEGPAPLGLPGHVTLLPSVRFDDFESRSALAADSADSKISSRLGLSYAPTRYLTVFTSWGEAFRAPSINELYLDGTHFSFPHIILGAPVFISNEFIANPDLRPEETETWEIGFGLDLQSLLANSDSLRIKASWFETDAENLIDIAVDFAFDTSCFSPPFLPCTAGTTQSRNVGQAKLSGYEVDLTYENGPFALTAALSEINGEDVATGDPLGTLTPARLFVDGRWLFDAQRLTLGGRVEIADAFNKTINPATQRDGYAVVGLYARWRPMVEHGLSINAGIANVFDEDYARVFAGVSEPGRSFRLDLTWSRHF